MRQQLEISLDLDRQDLNTLGGLFHEKQVAHSLADQ
jgi:hypothetical protein